MIYKPLSDIYGAMGDEENKEKYKRLFNELIKSDTERNEEIIGQVLLIK